MAYTSPARYSSRTLGSHRNTEPQLYFHDRIILKNGNQLYFRPQVKIEMFDSGSRVAFAVFNATGLDKMSFMRDDRLIMSSWSDIKDYMAIKPVTISVDGRYICARHPINMHSILLYLLFVLPRTSDISHTLVANNIVGHSDVVGT